jgi:hypothetical protein
VAGAVEDVVQHLVPNHHLVHGPVTSKKDVVIGAPVTCTLAAGALEAVPFYDRPTNPVEVSGTAGTGFRLRKPFTIDCRWPERHVPHWVEAASSQRQQ